MLGDFNEWAPGLTTHLLRSHLKSVDIHKHLRRRRTYPGVLPLLHLDHIYHDDALELAALTLHRTRTSLVSVRPPAAGGGLPDRRRPSHEAGRWVGARARILCALALAVGPRASWRPRTRSRSRTPRAAVTWTWTATGARSSTPTAAAPRGLPGPAAPGRLLERRAPRSGPGDLVEYDFDASPVLKVPGDWNTQRPELLYYEGLLWYRRRFDVNARGRPALPPALRGRELRGPRLGQRARGSATHEARLHAVLVRRDGAPAARVTNSVVVLVDNTRRREAVPTSMTDWWNYGGLTRPVRLLDLPDTFIRDYQVQLAHGSRRVRERLRAASTVRGPVQDVTIRVAGGAASSGGCGTGPDGRAAVPLRGGPGAVVAGEAARSTRSRSRPRPIASTERIGFRTIEVRGTEILLNGSPDLPAGYLRARGGAAAAGAGPGARRDARTQLGLGQGAARQLRAARALSAQRVDRPRGRPPGRAGLGRDPGLLDDRLERPASAGERAPASSRR